MAVIVSAAQMRGVFTGVEWTGRSAAGEKLFGALYNALVNDRALVWDVLVRQIVVDEEQGAIARESCTLVGIASAHCM